jgi:hypothetical protein
VRLVVCGVLVAACVSGAARVAEGQTVASVTPPARVAHDLAPDAVLIALRIGRLTEATVQGYRVRSEVLLPLSRFCQIVELRCHLSADGRLEANVEPGNRHLIIDVRSDSMHFGDHRVRIEPEFIRFDASELYVGSERLGDLLGVQLAVDWSDLSATVVNPDSLPITLRLRREASREAYDRGPSDARADVTLGLQHPSWDGAVLDYSLLAPSTDLAKGTTYGFGLGADVGGGSFEMVSQNERVAASWTGVWRDRPWVKQLRLGDVASTGARGRALRGIAITNAPYVRPSLVGSLRYAGALDPGWSVEAYRGGELVGFDSATSTGAFVIDLPVRYGENPVDFVAYGPFGQVRQFNRTYRVLAEVLPAGQFEYGLSGGRCPAPAFCRGTANLDLRYGVAPRWTVQGGLDRFWRDSLPDRTHPYAALAGNPTNSWGVESELIAGALARGALRYEPSINLHVEAEYLHFTRDSAPVFTVPGQRSQWRLTGFLRPRTDQGFLFFEGAIEQINTVNGPLTRSRLGASIQTDEVRLLPYVRTEDGNQAGALGRREAAGLAALVMPRPRWGTFLSEILLRATTEIERRQGLASWSAFLARPLAPGFRLEVGANWQRGDAAPTYTLTVTTYISAMRAVTFVQAPAGQPIIGTQFLQGSVLWDSRTAGLGVAPGPSLERAGLVGRVYLDQNENGMHDAAEPGIASVRVLVGSHVAVTDSAGFYRLWDLVPFEPVMVSIDSASLESPLLVPLFARTSIVPGPNRYRALDIALVEAGVIEGRVVRDGAGVGGVTLVLLDRSRGLRRPLVTFSDGGFYLMGVKPGDYELFIPVNVLDALGANAAALRFTLVPTANGIGRSDLEIRLTPRF